MTKYWSCSLHICTGFFCPNLHFKHIVNSLCKCRRMVLKFSHLKQLNALMTSGKLPVNRLETGSVINDQSLAELV